MESVAKVEGIEWVTKDNTIEYCTKPYELIINR